MVKGNRRSGAAAIAALTLAWGLGGCDSAKPTQRPPAPLPTSSAVKAGGPPEARPAPGAAAPIKVSPEERTSAYEVSWSVTTVGKKGSTEQALLLDYQIKALEELYVSDRLWDYDAKHERVDDPYGVYRFVQEGSLRLVFAPAPRPPGVQLGETYTPLYSRVLSGETRRQTVLIKLPIEEYSSLARDVGSPSVPSEVSRVYFVLGYRLRSTMSRAPAPPPRESGAKAGYVVHEPKLIVLALDLVQLPVKRRTGEIERFALPGEPGAAPR